MTINEIIRQVDENNPNAFSKATKVGWIAQLDGQIALDVMLMNIAEAEQFRYRLPEALDVTPLVGFPHDGIYALWLNVKIFAAQGETERYQNALQLYNAEHKSYVRWFAHTYAPAKGGSSAVTYYITAYGLAVQQGYSGSLDQWLEELKGEPGRDGTVAFDSLTAEQLAMLKGDDGLSAYALAVREGFDGSLEQWLESLQGESAYDLARQQGFDGSLERWLLSLKGETPQRGTDYWTPEDVAWMEQRMAQEAGKRHLPLTITVPASGWSGSGAPYTQTVSAAGILETDNPHYTVVYGTSASDRAAQRQAFICIDLLETAKGSVTLTCFDAKPGVDLTLQLEVNR